MSEILTFIIGVCIGWLICPHRKKQYKISKIDNHTITLSDANGFEEGDIVEIGYRGADK